MRGLSIPATRALPRLTFRAPACSFFSVRSLNRWLYLSSFQSWSGLTTDWNSIALYFRYLNQCLLCFASFSRMVFSVFLISLSLLNSKNLKRTQRTSKELKAFTLYQLKSIHFLYLFKSISISLQINFKWTSSPVQINLNYSQLFAFIQ